MTVMQRGVEVRCGPPGGEGRRFGNAPGEAGHHVEFSTKSRDTGTPAECTISIWNITDESLAFFEDPANIGIVRIGHKGRGLQTLFQGNPTPRTLSMKRQGGDWKMSVVLRDAGRALDYGRLDVSMTSATSGEQVLNEILDATGLGRGEIDIGSVLFPNSFVFSGAARRALDLLVGATATTASPRRWFVRDGDLYVLPKARPTKERAVVYSPENGTLVGSPTATETGGVSFKGVIVDTTLRVGRVVSLRSKRFDGFYKAIEVGFKGSNYGTPFYVNVKAVPYR